MEQETGSQGVTRVGVFATCLVDLIRPAVGFATVRLLEREGCRVSVPASQTCCGQPAYNSGDNVSAIAIARKVITTFASFDYVVVPSGSCAGTLSKHYPRMFANDPIWAPRAENLSNKTSISELASQIKGLDLFITGDSGPMHLAAAFQIPTVAIFGPTKDSETSQWLNEKSMIVKKNLECQPCMKRSCPLKHHNCMKLVEASDLITAINHLN